MPGFFEELTHRESKRALKAAWSIEGEAAGAKALFVREGDRSTLLTRDGAFPEELAGEMARLPSGQEGIVSCRGMRIFLESINGGRKLVICGAGHVAMPIITITRMMGMNVTVIDDRAEFAENAAGRGANRVICKPFAEGMAEIEGNEDTYFVIVTRGHRYDKDCVGAALRMAILLLTAADGGKLLFEGEASLSVTADEDGARYFIVGPDGEEVEVESIENGWAKVPGGFAKAEFLA